MKLEERNITIACVAALFRAAGIVRCPDDAEMTEQYRNSHAITQATEFVNACETAGLLPRDEALT